LRKEKPKPPDGGEGKTGGWEEGIGNEVRKKSLEEILFMLDPLPLLIWGGLARKPLLTGSINPERIR
jgi:hypothetical protein